MSNANVVTGVGYYEIQYFDGSRPWSGLPAGAAENFYRDLAAAIAPFPYRALGSNRSRSPAGSWLEVPPTSVHVVETREHYEATAGFPATSFWTANEFLVVPINSAQFPDGTYRFRVVGWNDAGGGEVTAPRVLPLCGSKEDNGWVLDVQQPVGP